MAVNGPLTAQMRDNDDTRQAQQRAGEAALPVLQRAAAGDGAAPLGLRSADEAASATLGEPMPVWAVPLDRLRADDGAQDPASLVVDARRA
jgi:hypothetical protein